MRSCWAAGTCAPLTSIRIVIFDVLASSVLSAAAATTSAASAWLHADSRSSAAARAMHDRNVERGRMEYLTTDGSGTGHWNEQGDEQAHHPLLGPVRHAGW